MLWEGVIVFPLMLLYTVVSVFRGKVPSTSQIHHRQRGWNFPQGAPELPTNCLHS
jgi:hypothetical protein